MSLKLNECIFTHGECFPQAHKHKHITSGLSFNSAKIEHSKPLIIKDKSCVCSYIVSVGVLTL